MSAEEEEEEEGTSATLQSAQLSQQTVERRGAPLKCSTPALIHFRGEEDAGLVELVGVCCGEGEACGEEFGEGVFGEGFVGGGEDIVGGGFLPDVGVCWGG